MCRRAAVMDEGRGAFTDLSALARTDSDRGGGPRVRCGSIERHEQSQHTDSRMSTRELARRRGLQWLALPVALRTRACPYAKRLVRERVVCIRERVCARACLQPPS